MKSFVHGTVFPNERTSLIRGGPTALAATLLVVGAFAVPAAAQNAYCAATGQNTQYEYIQSTTVSGALDGSGNNGGYYASTAPPRQLETGPNGMTLTPGFAYGSYTERWAVYVDLDQSGTYESSELLYTGYSSAAINVTLTVPDNAVRGFTGMRVMMRYGGTPAPCGTFYYGEVEDYTVNIVGPEELGQVATTTLIGFDDATDQSLAIVGRFEREGTVYNSSSFFSPSIGWSRERTLNVDVGTEIEWYAVVSATGERLLPTACSTIVGDTCRTAAGSVGEVVEFEAPAPVVPPDPPVGDQVFTFEGIFGGTTYQAGPTFDLDGVTFSTNGSYFFNLSDAPFTSSYLAFIDLQMTFPAAAQTVSFEYEGRCTNCTQTVTLSANGVPVQTFDANKDVIGNLTVDLPAGTTVLEFDKNIGIDNLAVIYE